MLRAALSPEFDLRLASKRPSRLKAATEWQVLAAPLPGPSRFAASQTPEVSIVVLAHDNLVFTRLCLESVLASTDESPYELIVIDNASADRTPDYLRALASVDSRVRPVLLKANLGFAAGVNRGFFEARGDTLVMLNNDTIVAPGWLEGLRRHLGHAAVGLVGPVTNQAPGVARVSDTYGTYTEFLSAAAARIQTAAGRAVGSLTLFCAALTRNVYRAVGPLDERFEVGMFEDDDYCLRIAEAGLSCRLAEDVLVHHFGEASLGRLVPQGTWKSIFDANRRRFEEKWGREWSGHVARDEPAYVGVIERLAAIVEALPDGARVLVASRGDERFCRIPGRTAGHFPQLADGTWAGSYPANDADANEHLEELSARGWTHVAFPTPARWWLDHYPSMTRRLERSGVVVDDPAAGIVFRLS